MMKLGLSMWSYAASVRRGELDIPGFIREAGHLGVGGVELLDFFWKDRNAELPAVEAALAGNGSARRRLLGRQQFCPA